jgi:hypothetical protein
MATYKGIQGFTIQNLSADPSNPIEGQVWYNSTSNVWKVEEATTAGAWATGNNMNTARRGLGGAGTQTAALAFGGNHHLLQVQQKNMMEQLGQLSRKFKYSKRDLAGCGTQTAALAFGGNPPPVTGATEEYDGSTWTTFPISLNTARTALAGAGTQTAALAFGGYYWCLQVPATGATEEYNGTYLDNILGSLNTARGTLAGAGTQTAALAFGGGSTPTTGATEEYDGSTWTSVILKFKYSKI